MRDALKHHGQHVQGVFAVDCRCSSFPRLGGGRETVRTSGGHDPGDGDSWDGALQVLHGHNGVHVAEQAAVDEEGLAQAGRGDVGHGQEALGHVRTGASAAVPSSEVDWFR